jgi:imidazolonepropionase-like amidohydrolase/Tol biopolymer transport system component
MKKTLFYTLFTLLSFGIIAQEADKADKWDVNNPLTPTNKLSFTTDEGTWMNLDVSPDGKTVVFDLLGDIYSMSISGGKAKLLRGGHAFEVQPRFSPNGKQVCFTSDAGGADNVWVMDLDGENAKQITKEDFRLLNNGVFTPDGEYIVARKHFTGTRSLGAGELWMYHISGGSGIQLTKKKNTQQDVNEPTVSPDGRYIYFSEDMYPGGYFQYNKDPNSQIYVIKRYDRETGEIETITGGPGGACRPQISRDGKKLAFVRRVREKTVLYIHDLETGEEKPVFDGLSKDQQEAWAIFGTYTGFAWMPSNQEVVVWGKGKIHRVNVETSASQLIPFEVKSNHEITEAVRFKQTVSPDKFTAKVIRHAVTSPDEKTLVFSSLGHLWKKELPNGKLARLTTGKDFEFEPNFSADGKQLVFVTWNDEQTGAIHTLNWTEAGAKPVKISDEKGIFREPSFSPNGKTIVYRKEGGNDQQGFTYSKKPGLYTIGRNGMNKQFVTESGIFPRFNTTGNRIYFQTGGYFFGALGKAYKSVNLSGNDEQEHLTSKYANQFVPSPDGNWVAFIELFKVYIAPMPKHGQSFELTKSTKAVPVTQVAKDAGINLHWSADSKKLHWTLGEEYFTDQLQERFAFVEGAPEKLPEMDTEGIRVNLEVETAVPTGIIALKNARIITMKGHEVIENGVVIVEGNKIKEIGEASAIKIPKGAKEIDCSGKTIMPGIVDVHAHLGNFRYGLSPQKQWEYYANLAYGVTTAHDPSSHTEMIFSHAEMIRAGEMLGPRVYSTGIILYGADGDFKAVINNYEDAKSALRRTKAYGAFSVKSYNQPRREQRQQVIKAAQELEMMVVPEGGSHFFHNMTMILDGHTGIEHNIPVAPAYKDVAELWSASKTGYTPTLIVNYGGLNGEYYWYQKTNVWEKQRLLNFTPRGIVDSRSRHRTMVPDKEYENGHILVSQTCKKLSDAGVKVNLGAHGQLQGLGAHWELWMLAQGGMTPLEAIRSATLNGAHYLGMDSEIGSLEAGKLADLIVLDKNPLENIQNTEFVKYTMVNGKLYDSATLNEIGNTETKRGKFYWELPNYNPAFQWHEETKSFTTPKCSCGEH